MSTLRELKGRIGSVASSEKITGAMKMISSAKMHKAEQNLSRLVPFRNQLQDIMGNLMQTDAEYTSELTDVRDVKTVTIVVLGSDEGLCGAYNINIFKGLLRHINELRKANPSVMINVVPVGKKIVKAAAVVAGDGVSVERTEASPESGIDGIRRLVDTLKADYVGGKTDRVEVVSMKFLSAGKQRLTVQQLLPVSAESFGKADGPTNRPYLFEPDANRIYNACAGSVWAERRLRAGSARDGNAECQRQCSKAARLSEIGIQQAASAGYYDRIARHTRRPG